jgi:hypothetical protein
VNDYVSSDDGLRARLRAVDPAASLAPADPTRVHRLLEDTMSDGRDIRTAETRATGTSHRGPLTWVLAAAAVVLIAGGGVVAGLALSGDDDVPVAGRETAIDEATVTSLSAGASPARCMVPDADAIGRQELAFEGTVQEIDDDVVVLVPSRFFRGQETDLVEVASPPAELRELVEAVEFVDGERYLISATDDRVTLCGMTGRATPRLEALYAEAFPG